MQFAEKQLRDETEMRAFYRSFGIAPAIIDAAIKVRYRTADEDVPDSDITRSKMAGRRKRRHSSVTSGNAAPHRKD
jgi:hypothetical protein